MPKTSLTKSTRLNSFLRKMGIFSNYDVVNHLPKKYDNFALSADTNLEDKQRVVLYGKLASLPKHVFSRRVDINTFDFLTESKRYFRVVVYNRPYLSFNMEDDYTIIGTYNKKRNEINFVNFNKGKIDNDKTLKPVYALPTGYQNHLFHTLVNRCLQELDGHIGSVVPLYYRKKYRLIDKATALNKAHNPKTLEDIRQAYRYLKYEEALTFSLKNQLIRETNKSLKKVKKEPIDLSSCEEFLSSLPYQLTEDQKKASEEIIEDMNQSSLMYRLLQGDVGTGKTLVSFIALYANYKRGDQGALMAPTDVLARQHYQNALKLFANTKVKVALLVGETSASEKRRIYDDLQDGYIDIVIGTHALFTKSVTYSSLGLVIIDEQHRFGVNQRKALLDKGDHADLLMMSATPIPRSLALSIYGDLEISTLYTFPSSRRDIVTKVVSSDSQVIFDECDKSLEEKRKIYVVAPLIEYREDGRYSAEQLFARFLLRYGAKVGLLHGKMKNVEKNEVIERFTNGDIDILVSTQVIEVGIDVKIANLMIIYDANAYGLSSLHQLRGRIGRNGESSTCLLVYDEEEEEAVEKLNVLVNSNDGFEIAEEDLKMRGPGELTGIRQSGLPDFQYLNMIDDIKIFITARDDAKYILEHRDSQEFSYIIKRCLKEINETEILKA